jgi:hypothetical protein
VQNVTLKAPLTSAGGQNIAGSFGRVPGAEERQMNDRKLVIVNLWKKIARDRFRRDCKTSDSLNLREWHCITLGLIADFKSLGEEIRLAQENDAHHKIDDQQWRSYSDLRRMIDDALRASAKLCPASFQDLVSMFEVMAAVADFQVESAPFTTLLRSLHQGMARCPMPSRFKLPRRRLAKPATKRFDPSERE